MIPEKRFLNQIQQVLARLMQPLWLLDTEGTVLLPEENRSKINLPEFMEPGMPVAFEGKPSDDWHYPGTDLCADAQVRRRMTASCCGRDGAVHGRGEAPIQSRDVYRRVLREELAGSELEALAHEHQIEMNRSAVCSPSRFFRRKRNRVQHARRACARAGGDCWWRWTATPSFPQEHGECRVL
ncbi:MAG: hypothetical protein ACLS7Z_09520 [Christensenellales bacterium]